MWVPWSGRQPPPREIADVYPEIGRARIGGFLNILVHQHFSADHDTIRDVATNHLPPLADALRPTWVADLEPPSWRPQLRVGSARLKVDHPVHPADGVGVRSPAAPAATSQRDVAS